MAEEVRLTSDERLELQTADGRKVTPTPGAHATSHAPGGTDALTGYATSSDLTPLVAKATYDANTILKADSDNTPVALSVAASTVVGRKSSGGIAALTGTEVDALLPARAASAITFSPTGTIAATDVQAAIAEVASEAGAGGSVSGMVGGVINATDATYGAVADAQLTTDGTVAAGTLSTLTSASNPFVSGDVGKTVTLMRTVVVTDAAISSGTAILTSPGTQFPSWIKAGMTINVSGAGAAGVSLVTTVLSNDSTGQLTLSANASTTVSAQTAGIYAIHRTTISAFGSAGSVSLTAAAPYAFAGANLLWGTDNRVALAAAEAAARAANKPMYVPTGKYLVALDSTNRYVANFTAGRLIVKGAGRTATGFYVAGSAVPTNEMGLFKGGTGSSIECYDFTTFNIGVPMTNSGNAISPFIASIARAGTSELQIRMERVTSDATYPMGWPVSFQAGTGTADTRLWIIDCNLYAIAHATTFFINSGTTVAEFYAVRSHFESTFTVLTTSNDNQYNPHATYCHPPVAIDWEDCSTKVNSTAALAYHLHHFGGPTGSQKWYRIKKHFCKGPLGLGLICASSATAGEAITLATLDNCVFECRTGIWPQTAVRVTNCVFKTTAASVSGATATNVLHEFVGCSFTNEAFTSGISAVPTAGAGTVWTFDKCNFYVQNISLTAMITLTTGVDHDVIVRDCNFFGDTSNSKNGVSLSVGNRLFMQGGVIQGVWTSGFALLNFSADDQADHRFDNVKINITSGNLTISNAAPFAGNIRGANNLIVAGAPTMGSGAGRAMDFVPAARKSGTALASASTISPTLNFDTYDVSGTTTVNNIFVGGNAQTNRCRSGRLFLTATGAWTLASTGGGTGNIRTKSGSDRVMAAGETVELIADNRNGLWLEVN